jgi:hypothetical protein
MSGDHGGDALGEDDGPVFIDFESLGVLSRSSASSATTQKCSVFFCWFR